MLAGIAVLGFWAALSIRSQAPGPVVREIDDRATGDRWVLVRDVANPGGPGRMLRVAGGDGDSGEKIAGAGLHSSAQSAAHAAAAPPVAPPMICAGDRVMVEEHSAVVDARLEATAMGSAGMGAEFQARLKIGGKMVRVIALGPGRAELAPEAKAHP
jgi:hypothetical protein